MNKLTINIQEKSFPDNLCVLKNFKFEVNSGEFVAIVGPSGAGKTTLLNIIAGIDDDYKGKVSTSLKKLSVTEKLNIGFMFQQSRLMPWLTVTENITLVMKAHAEPGGMMNKAMQLIKQVGLSGFENSYPRQLSGGMQKRVALARAFAVEPQLLLLDEPFASLDSPTANKFRRQLMSLWNSQIQTIVFVTHDLREAISMADRILFLSDRPSTILLDYKVNLKHPRSIDSSAVSQMHQEILTQHPEILAGLL